MRDQLSLAVLNRYFYNIFYRSLSLYIVQYTMISGAFVRVSSRDLCLCYRGVFFVIVLYHGFLLGVGFLLGFKRRGVGGYRAAHHRRATRFHTDKNKKALSKIPQEKKKTVSVKLNFRVVFYLNIFGHFGQYLIII